MDPRIMVVANEVIKMIKVQLDPTSDRNQRHQAYQVHEEFKRKSPFCDEVGFYMYKDRTFDTSIRLCGLQLVEWFVQKDWDDLDSSWRDKMKVRMMGLIEEADFKEEDCLKEAVVKVIVEVIKRSWPQQWSSLFDDLAKLHVQGDAQIELVLIVLMRLSEDLHGLDDKVKQQRRKDMVSTLNQHIEELLQFFITTIHEKTLKLKECNNEENLRVATAALYTIAEYATWVKFDFLITEEKVLFQVLFWLLEIDQIKYNAAHCLCTIFQRKGEPEKRVEMMVILSDDALSIIENSAQKSANRAELGDIEEYKFLKKLAEMVMHFGRSQIAPLWGDGQILGVRPKCFGRYLKIMLDFLKHDSMLIIGISAKLWHSFGFHKEIQKDEMFLSAVQILPKELLKSMAKLSNPCLPHNPGSKYSIMDFDDQEDFHNAYREVRCAAVDIMKNITSFIPLHILQLIMDTTKEYLGSESPNVDGYTSKQIVNMNHYLKWDAFQQFCRHFFVRFLQKMPEHVTPEVVQQCNACLKTLIGYSCENPILLTPILLTMESLFPVFKYSQELLTPSMQKLTSLMHLPNPEYDQHSQFKLKRCSINILFNLCCQNSELLADKFDDLKMFFGIKAGENIFTNHEKRLLLESLLYVSKSLKDTEKMNAFIDEVFKLPSAFFNRDDIQESMRNTTRFITFLGLDKDNQNDASVARRNELIMALYTVEASARVLIMNTGEEINDYPEDSDIAESISKYPWMQHMINILPHIFDTARQVCFLWTKAEGDDQTPSFEKLLLPNECEIGFPVKKMEAPGEQDDVGSCRQTPNRQYMIFAVHEAIYTSLSLYGRCLGPVLFSLPGMMETFIEKVVKSWVHLPNFRMRKIWRSTVKSFSMRCPAKYYESVLGPFLAVAIDQMFQRLSKEWPRVQEMEKVKRSIDGQDNIETDESSEISELRGMYNLSKEVLDILESLCTFKGEKKENVKAVEGCVDIIGKLGTFLLTWPQTNLMLITMFFTALTWPDTSVVDRLCIVITAIVRKMFVPENPVNPEIANQMMLRLLQGLQIHGGDPTGQSSIINATLSVYLHLRKQYPRIIHIMMMVPTCKEEELKNFDLTVFVDATNINESTKRKRFRKLVEGAIGKTVSELHKNDLKIQDLPPLAPRVKPAKVDIVEETEDAGLCRLFAPVD